MSFRNRKGVTRIKPNEAQGTAGQRQKSKSEVAGGFNFGLNNMVKASKSASPMPKNVSNSTGCGMKPRKGVWHPGAERP